MKGKGEIECESVYKEKVKIKSGSITNLIDRCTLHPPKYIILIIQVNFFIVNALVL